MISVRYYCVGSIILLSLLSASHTQEVSSYLKPFVNFFRNPENVFDIVYILSQLKYNDKILICYSLARQEISNAGNEIVLVNLDRSVAPTLIPENMPDIPSFKCETVNKTHFFVTHSPDRAYYQLFESSYKTASSSNFLQPTSSMSNPEKTFVKLHHSMLVTTSYNKDFRRTLQRLLNYFRDAKYREAARFRIQSHRDQRKLTHICRLFPSHFDNENYTAVPFSSPMKVHGQRIDSNIPCILCKPDGHPDDETTAFKVFRYYGSIFFKGPCDRNYQNAIEYRLESYGS